MAGNWLLWLLVQLPYPVIYRLGTALGRLAMRVMKSRARIARRNLELCFPEMSAADREALLVKNFESLGMGLMETGMAWFWPTHRVARWTETSGVNEVVELLEEKQGILLIGIHFLTLEMGARMYGMFTPCIGVYRPNDNPLIDWLQPGDACALTRPCWIEKSERDGQGAKRGEILWYAPDHDYGPASSVFAPLFAVEQAATTTGTGCWRKCPGRRLCRLFRGASPTAWGMN